MDGGDLARMQIVSTVEGSRRRFDCRYSQHRCLSQPLNAHDFATILYLCFARHAQF
jgi:hypothetical protein